jgi:Glycosyl transferase family 2
MGLPSYNIYVSGRGNIFMTEIASMLKNVLVATGREAQLRHIGLPTEAAGTINMVVAPHEYFILDDSVTEAERVYAAAHCVTVGVEQPGTSWFEIGARYASYGALALDINKSAVQELRRRGLEAYWLPLGYYPAWDSWGGDQNKERTRDLVFLGSLSERRERFLAESASLLADWNCDIRLFPVEGPVRSGTQHFLTGDEKYELLADSRVLLNVHQTNNKYFEWVRLLEAISNGCLVVSESSVGYRPLLPTKHFIECNLPSLAGRSVALLSNEEVRAEITQSAYHFVREHLPATTCIDKVLAAIEDRLMAIRLRSPCAASTGNEGSAKTSGSPVAREPADGGAPLAQEDQPRSSPTDRRQQTRALVKDLLLAEMDERRALEALYAALRYGDAKYHRSFDSASYSANSPEVSVLITVYNYHQYLQQAIESVIASEGVSYEVVIVDDHSTDGSVDVAKRIMEKYPSVPMRLIAKSANEGAAAARNLGFSHARAETVFVLDADNVVFPRALRSLLDLLSTSGAAMAYGIVEVYGDRIGLVSCLPWDIDRLVTANYIDMMALIRKSVWRDLGGFDSGMDRLGGWDDYDFWLNLASAGYTGAFWPDFVGSYRAHDSSWQATTVDLDTSALRDHLRSKYPRLPWPTRKTAVSWQ